MPAAKIRIWSIRRILIATPLILLAVGLGVDACSGLPVSRGAQSPQAWLAGVLGIGALYLLGEGMAGWVSERDKVTDPLWMRGLHLAALLAVWAVFMVALRFLMRLVVP